MSSVLNMRRETVVPQPLTSNEIIFQWNGELYPYHSQDSYAYDEAPPLGENDTQWVYKQLLSIVRGDTLVQNGSAVQDHAAVLRSITKNIAIFFELPYFKGSYAFAITVPALSAVIYGRDKLGRRSLVRILGQSTHSSSNSLQFPLGLASVGYTYRDEGFQIFSEDIPVDGIYCLYYDTNGSLHTLCELWKCAFLDRHPCSATAGGVILSHKNSFAMPSMNVASLLPVTSYTFDAESDTCRTDAGLFLHALYYAVAERLIACPLSVTGNDALHVSVLFSGGVDCMLLSALIHWVLKAEFSSPTAETAVIELLNVSFGDAPETSPDRISARIGVEELHRAFPERKFQLYLVDVPERETHADRIRSLVSPSQTVMDLNISTALWFAASGVGACIDGAAPDITIRSTRLYRVVESENSLDLQLEKDSLHFGHLEAAIRAEGLLSSDQRGATPYPMSLFGSSPNKIPYKKFGFKKLYEYMKAAEKHGLCRVTTDDQKNHWITPSVVADEISCAQVAKTRRRLGMAKAKLIFSGLGADELCAGYRRHRAAFHSRYDRHLSPQQRLLRELDADCSNLWYRNCGRDDRTISDHGKEVALPFLDERVVDAIRAIGAGDACTGEATTQGVLWDLNHPDGIGDKKIVRTAARMVGLTASSRLAKRAIQFGSRIAERRIKGETRIHD